MIELAGEVFPAIFGKKVLPLWNFDLIFLFLTIRMRNIGEEPLTMKRIGAIVRKLIVLHYKMK
jgi:hypothetical protein